MFVVRGSGLGKVVVQFATALSLCTAVVAAGVLTSMPAEGHASQQVVAGASDNNWPSVPTVGTDNNWPNRLLDAADNNWPNKPLGTDDNNWPNKPLDAADNNWPTGPDDGTDNNWPKV
ncbi:hypothetical protein ABZ027_41360 [Streptomyces sp. NPDC006332]|uniref:hypothetical protein n=1 Tax=Streptomyces sp. NPDC006332 TaxID=3155456 RepID=UPI0033BE7235